MAVTQQSDRWRRGPRRLLLLLGGLSAGGVLLIGTVLGGLLMIATSLVEVPTGSQAVLIRKTGMDLAPDQEIAPPTDGKGYYKGVQSHVLTEGRYFYNPFYWDWEILPQFEIPKDKIGIKINLVGDDLAPGQVIAEAGTKGIQSQVLMPGRYPYNPYAEQIELHDPVNVPAGYRGVVTLLAGKSPKDPNVVLVGEGERGVQSTTLPPGTYYLNPFERRVSLVDCRSQRFNLGEEGAMDFLSADGFSVMIDGQIEFRIVEAKVPEVFVLYNEDFNKDEISDEIIRKIITPESRSICRIGGSKLSGVQFISGNDREEFQRNLDASLKANCLKQGVEILSVAITSIKPPEEIATPVRAREVAKQRLAQFQQEKLQQESEAQLRVQELLAEQKKAIVEAEQSVVEVTTKAEQEQQVASTLAKQKLKVAETNLEATKDKTAAILSGAKADADVIRFKNQAEVAGLAARVKAFQGDGMALAENTMISKLAPAFKTILSNTDGPLMELFGQFTRSGATGKPSSSPTRPKVGGPTVSSPPEVKPGRPGGVNPAAELPVNPFASAEVRP